MKWLDDDTRYSQRSCFGGAHTRGDDNDRGRWVSDMPLGKELFEERPAIHSRHGQVQENDIWETPFARSVIDPCQGFIAFGSFRRLVPIQFERPRNHIPNGGVVIHYQDDRLATFNVFLLLAHVPLALFPSAIMLHHDTEYKKPLIAW